MGMVLTKLILEIENQPIFIVIKTTQKCPKMYPFAVTKIKLLQNNT
jgi:hypothetical protein